MNRKIKVLCFQVLNKKQTNFLLYPPTISNLDVTHLHLNLRCWQSSPSINSSHVLFYFAYKCFKLHDRGFFFFLSSILTHSIITLKSKAHIADKQQMKIWLKALRCSRVILRVCAGWPSGSRLVCLQRPLLPIVPGKGCEARC